MQQEINELIVVEQLPKITEKLQLISDEIDKEVSLALSLECNEDTKNEVKQARTRINKIKTELENRRKQVKQAVLSPYEQFETVYNDLVKSKLNEADTTLKSRIDTIEMIQKQEKEQELREFAEMWFESKDINNIVSFEDIGLNITLSASMKSLKDQIIAFTMAIRQDMDLIAMEELKDEIFLEYIHCLDFAKSKMCVLERHKALEVLRKDEEVEQENTLQQQVKEEVEEIITEPEIIEEDITLTFTVTGTKTQLIELREYMKERGIRYE